MLKNILKATLRKLRKDLGYTYPASLDTWMFVGTGLFAVLVTLVSMSVSAVRAGETNPAESLRAE